MQEEAKPKEGKDVKIGELLVQVGVVTNSDLQEAIQIAKRMTLPIGRVIVMSGVISEQNLQFALEAQSLIKDGFLDLDTAYTALKNAYKNGITLQTALADLRWAPTKNVASNRLGEILMDSNMVSQAQLDQALQISFETGMPLGGTLVIQGVLSAQLLPMVLNAQEQIRDGKITRAGAVENLKSALMFWAKADDSKVGETKDGLAALQNDSRAASSYRTSLPESSYLLSETTASIASPLDFTASTPSKPLTPSAASSSQRTFKSDQAPDLVPSTNMGLIDMMKMAGYCNDQEIKAAIDRALANADIASKLFLATGLLTKTSFENFVRCRALVVRGALRPEQAIYALTACRLRGVALEDAFIELGLKIT